MSDDTATAEAQENATVILTFRVPPTLAARLNRAAKRRGLNRTAFIVLALLRAIRRDERAA